MAFIGVGVGWQRRCQTRQLLRELDNKGYCFGFEVTVDGGRDIVRGGGPQLRTRVVIVSRSLLLGTHEAAK